MSFPQFGEIVQETDAAEFPEFGEVVEKSPGIRQETARHVGRSGLRAVEALAGLPGDLLSIPRKLISSAGARLTGLPEEKVEKFVPGKRLLPSSELRDFSKKIFGSKFEPQNPKEELSDAIVQDASTFLVPIKGKIPFARSIGTAVLGNLASKGVEELGFGEGAQTAAKIGTFFLSSLVGKGNVKKFWNQKYAQADAATPANATFSAIDVRKDLDEIKKVLKSGLTTPSKTAVLKPLEEIGSKISRGRMKVSDARQAKIDINELRENLFDEVKGKTARRGARTKLNDVSAALDKGLEAYGKTNPDFYEPFKAAQEAYSGYQASRKVGKFIGKTLNLGKFSKGSLILLEAVLKPTLLPYTAGAYGALKGAELVARMFKNPTLRKYYGNIIQSALQENTPATLRNLRGLEKEAQKHPELFEELRGQQEAE